MNNVHLTRKFEMFLFLAFVLFSQRPILGQDLAEQLLSLLSPTPPLGEPWPNIPGPNLQDRVCIVGAGAAGIHMAVSLKKRNYNKVTIRGCPFFMLYRLG